MSALSGKKILILSPQSWGKMLLSKHHYALELAKAGNKVYFLNPPDQSGSISRGAIQVELSELSSNLHFIQHRTFFPFWIKFRSFTLFQWLMKFQIARLLKQLGKIDIVWSFDIGDTCPLKYFPSSALKVFHPVDEPLSSAAINAAIGSNIIFSVTREILDKYKNFSVPKHFIHHGVTESFLKSVDQPGYQLAEKVKVGYSGNLLRDDMDRQTLLSIVRQNPSIEFHFFGSYKVDQTNIGGNESRELQSFVADITSQKNVVMHGVLTQGQLADQFNRMDAFLVCYDIEKDQSKGTNYHKLMEYIATGKVIISNNVTTYAQYPNLVQMTNTRDHNNGLPELFKSVITNLHYHNSAALMEERKAFARSNTYSKQVERIESCLDNLVK